MARTKRSASVSTQDVGQTGLKKARPNLNQKAAASRIGRHGSVSDVLGSEYGISDEYDDGSNDDQNDLDDARNALKNLQAAIEKAEKSDTFSKDMEKKVMIDERRLRNMVKEEEEKWEKDEEIFRSRFSSLAKVVLSSRANRADPASSSLEHPLRTATSDTMLAACGHPLYLKTQGLLQSARALVNGLDSISTHTSGVKIPQNPKGGLEKDIAEACRIISQGAEATAMMVEKQLVYEKNDTRRDSLGKLQAREQQEAFLNDNNLQAMFEMGRDDMSASTEDDLNAQGWGFVAHHMEGGMRELVKALRES
ncbi:hypothetical protein FQN49_000958 [Arthroderma sp. PD_2]|nr:hypothetical protein FQN49_000958 [Arthroderma sp. PD_2]